MPLAFGHRTHKPPRHLARIAVSTHYEHAPSDVTGQHWLSGLLYLDEEPFPLDDGTRAELLGRHYANLLQQVVWVAEVNEYRSGIHNVFPTKRKEAA